MNISNHYSNTVVTGTSGNDSISNWGSNVTINANAGNDSIQNNGADMGDDGGVHALINGGAGNDTINNEAYDSTIDGAEGDDSIENREGSASISGGYGNDTIEGHSTYLTINSGADNDFIRNWSNGSMVDAGTGDDSITNEGNKVTLSGGEGADTISNSGSEVTISGNGGDDYISNNGYDVKIAGGSGNDSISNRGDRSLFQYSEGDEDDLIEGFKENSTLQIGDGNGTYSKKIVGNDIILTVGTGKITLKGANTLSNVNIDGVRVIYVDKNYSNKERKAFLIGNNSPNIISNSGSEVTISGNGGNDSIQNTYGGDLTSVNAGKGNDYISNQCTSVTIDAGAGDDSIHNDGGANISISGGDGNDTISNIANINRELPTNTTIIGGAGDDSIENHGSNTSISGGIGNDTIMNTSYGTNTTLLGGAGNDYISNYGENVRINSGTGNDNISNYIGENVTINALGGNDTISNYSSKVTIEGGSGDDSIYNEGSNTSISGGIGNDTIMNTSYGTNTTLLGGAGNDYISNYGENVTIEGGSGNDSIYNEGSNILFQHKFGNGNDIIEGFNETSTLDIGLETFASIKSGNDLIIKVGDDEITLTGAATLSTVHIKGVNDEILKVNNTKDNVSIVGGLYDDTIKNSGKNVTIFGNGGNDSIKNSGSEAKIYGGKGNDIVRNYINNVTINGDEGSDRLFNYRHNYVLMNGGAGSDSIVNNGSFVTIQAQGGNDSISNLRNGSNSIILSGSGNDSIANGQAQAKLNGEAGNDYIYNDGNTVTIEGGKGSDTIQNNGTSGYGENVIFKYKDGDGNDLIRDFRENSTLSISGAAAFSAKSGADIIMTVGGGQITLAGAGNLSSVNIIETPININNDASNQTITGTNANDTIINTGEKVTILALNGNDSLNNNAEKVSIDAGANDDFISNTGKRTTLKGQSGSDTINNNAGNVLAIGGAGNDSIFNHGQAVSISGVEGSNLIENYTNSNEVSIMGGAEADSIQNRSSKSTISGENGSDTILSNGNSNSIIGGADSDLISIQGAYKNTIIGGTGNDTINLDWSSNEALIQYSKGDGNDVIEGFNATSTLQLGDGNETYSKAFSGDDVIITVGGEKITLKGAANLARLNINGVIRLIVNNTENIISIVGGRLDDSVKNSGNKVTISTFEGSDTVENSGSRVIIDAGDDSDLISNNDGNYVTINAASGNDFISNVNSTNVIINAGDFGDTVSVSGGEKNTINGNAGNDFIYISPTEKELLIQHNTGDGNDYIAGFNATSTLQLGDGTDTFSKTIKGGNVIITTGEEKITLAGAASVSPLYIRGVEEIAGDILYNHELNKVINGTEGNDTIRNYVRNVTISGNGGRDYIVNTGYNISISGGIGNDTLINEAGNTTVRNDGESITLEGDAGNDVIENRVAYVSINGGEGDDSISSYRSNNTIIGGTGNDTIYNNWNFLRNEINYGTNAANVSFNYTFGDGNDIIYGFNKTSTLNIAGGEFTSVQSGDDIIFTMSGSNVTLKDAGKLATVNVVHFKVENPLDIVNTKDRTLIVGTSLDDTIYNSGQNVTILAQGGNDSIKNQANDAKINADAGNDSISNTSGNYVSIDAGTDNDSIVNDNSFYTSIAGGDGNDLITVLSSSQVTVNAGKDEDAINLSDSDETFIEYNAGDGNDIIYGFDDMATLNIAKTEFTSATTGNDIVITVGTNKITLEGAATLSNPHIINGTQANFRIKNGAVTCESDLPKSIIKETYQFNAANSLLTLNDKLQNYTVNVKADDAGKVKWHYGTANLVSGSTLEYKLDEGKNTATLTSKNYGDKITFDEDTTFNFGRIEAETFKNSTVTTKGAKRISFENNSSASIKAPRNYQIGVTESNITVNDLPINAISGAGTVTIEKSGMNFEGYGVQFADLEVAKESYFGKLAPMTVAYNSDDKTYTLYNTACVKTLSNDFTKLTFNFSGNNDEKYAYYKINNLAISTVKKDISGVEVSGNKFKIQGKEIDAEKIGRITLDEQITFSGTEINFDGVKVNYTHNKPVIYSADGKEITLNDAASLTTGDETKTFKCEAGSYTVNGRSFETSAPLTFSADTKEIRIPLSDAATEIYFDGVKVSGISGRELVFDSDKVTIPNDASINIISPNAVKLNLAAGDYTIDGKKVTSTGGVKTSAEIGGNGLPADSITTTESGEFKIHDKTYKITGDRDGVTFLTDSRGMVSEIKGLEGSVEGNFENAIRVNGKAIQISGASSIKVTSDGEKITEISNVAGDLITTNGKTYRKNVRVYELGGAEKLTTSADGTIIFSGNKFETSAGKTFTLDEKGNVSGIEKAQAANVSANVLEDDSIEENLATINLSTTNNLDEVFGDFSEGLTVNGVFVKVTDSTNFIVKNDDENVYIETTAPDNFTINGKTFTTYADKTIFKLDASGNVSEIVTDKFYLYPEENVYLIEGDFSDEIIFNGQKFCVTGTKDTTIFVGEETLIGVELARNAVEVVESNDADEIAVNGGGEITVGGKTFSTADDFAGTLKTNSIENFVGTIEGELGGLDLAGITIESEDNFIVTGDGEKITAINNLQNGSLTGNLDGITINGEKISLDDLDEVTLTIQDGELKIPDENDAEKITDMFTGDAAKIIVAGSRATVTNYDYKGGEAFRTEYENIADAIEENSIAYDDGRLTVDSATIIFAEDADSRLINFVDATDELQKVGFVSDDSKLDASKEKGSLILVGASNSTLAGGKGQNQIYLDDNSESTILLNGKNTIHNFSGGDKISVSAANSNFSFDGEKVKIKSGTARATLENISSDGDAARILTVINGKETKTAIAQAGAVMSMNDDLADVYYGEKSGVDFSGFENSLTVDLRENFNGINRVTVGGGLNTLISSSRNETLTGNGTTEYIFDKGNGRDVIQNFNFDEDKINVGTNAVTNVRIDKAGGVRMEIGYNGWLTLENAQGKNFKINNFVAIADENLTYNATANYFVATAQNASLTVGESAEIWLDGSHGKTFSGDIRTLDASTAQGKTSLAGNDLDNKIFAGKGDSTLWGGSGGDDLLVGGTGKNTFYYLQGNGNDTIQGANNGDVVYLSTVTLEQISGTSITGDAVSINFTDGGSLQVNSNANVTYQLADGSKFSANHVQSSWIAS